MSDVRVRPVYEARHQAAAVKLACLLIPGALVGLAPAIAAAQAPTGFRVGAAAGVSIATFGGDLDGFGHGTGLALGISVGYDLSGDAWVETGLGGGSALHLEGRYHLGMLDLEDPSGPVEVRNRALTVLTAVTVPVGEQ